MSSLLLLLFVARGFCCFYSQSRVCPFFYNCCHHCYNSHILVSDTLVDAILNLLTSLLIFSSSIVACCSVCSKVWLFLLLLFGIVMVIPVIFAVIPVIATVVSVFFETKLSWLAAVVTLLLEIFFILFIR